MRKIHRDMTPDERQQVSHIDQNLRQVLDLLESGQIAIENMTPETVERLRQFFTRKG
jgi:superfamily I DNA and RNA helicase